ncbi:hypothetical protein K440DRAFT_635975 [Wilcoxina mikolae CBS 423.85]|nr:hypothetical protein K440DRAFT_635975 [Wilcoxina mikolae CBS 423.85]
MTTDQEQFGHDPFAFNSQGYTPTLCVGSGQTYSEAFSGSDDNKLPSTHGGIGRAPNNKYAREPRISTHQYARMLLKLPDTPLLPEAENFVQQSFKGASNQPYQEPTVYGQENPHFLQGSWGMLGSNVLDNEYGKLKVYKYNVSQHQGDGNHTKVQSWPENPSPLPLGPSFEMGSDSLYGSGAMLQPSTTLRQQMDATFNNGLAPELSKKQQCPESVTALERHVQTKRVRPGVFFCTVESCERARMHKGFSRKDNLTQHLRQVHGQKIEKKRGRND